MMMRVPAWCTTRTLAALFILGLCQASANASQQNIVAVDGTLCDLTSTLVGDAARVTCLIPPGGNPHSYQLKPSDRQTLAGAALVVHNGFNLTPSVRKISASGPIVAVGEVALPSYSGSDPHVWHDPQATAAMVGAISRELKKVLPAESHAGLSRRTSQAMAVFNGLSAWGSTQFANLPESRRVIVTDHRTYSHMADRFGFREIAMLDSHTTGGVLRPSSLNAITKEIKSSDVLVLFKPSWNATKTLKRISKRSGVPISSMPLNGEGVAVGETAVSTATNNICTMVNGQGGQCDQVEAARLAKSWSAIR